MSSVTINRFPDELAFLFEPRAFRFGWAPTGPLSLPPQQCGWLLHTSVLCFLP